MRSHSTIFIGTAGWSLPREATGDFPISGSHLHRYAQRLNGAEINSSFYRSHTRATYERWAGDVPSSFKFAVKVPGAITHDSGLRRARKPLEQFLSSVGGLGKKLGPLLIQLPPSRMFEPRIARRFCSVIRELHRGPVVIEPRHVSWFTAKPTRLLTEHRISRVAADPAICPAAARPGGACDRLQYYRLHGSPHMYWSSYAPAYLRTFANTVEGADSSASTWIIFDNTAAGCGTANARQLQILLQNRASRAR
jgi:uncharacterized protein YecE (DUF72 family)